ncbi:SigE family RNA polymerase sigma factor [Nocardioides sp.]|uniref:SigE family RNA polymerase sigma factor n=1 Tax=Nocardioides sp. TaxID=35761 RepID=UPI002ED40080
MRPDLEAEFENFVAATSQRLFRAAYAITRDHHLAEDAVQSALGKAYARWARVNRSDQPEAYVRRMVVNEVLSWRRRKSSTELPTEIPLEDDPRRAPTSHDTTLADSDAMWQALGQLAPRQRAVVVLRYYEHLSEAEIAETLGVRPGTVKSQSAAALARLRLLLSETTTEGERV